MSERRHLIQLSRIALAVAAIDLGTKAAAKRLLIQDPGVFSSPLQLAVVHNNAGAFGWSAGIYTWQLNLALTLAAIVFMIPVTRDLARIDSSAPRALGLIVGGALGNLASLVTSPKGVIDFIAINFESWGIVLNVADVAAYLGLAMILRTGCLIALAIVRDRRVAVVRERSTVRAVFAEHAAARASRRVGGSDDWVRRPELEVAVGGLGLLRDKPPLLADGAREVEREVVVFDLEVARRRR
ncbi:MAG: signal peptidase II, partial [Gemmatimonadaceae bacterium]